MVQIFQLDAASDVPTGEVETFLAAGAGFTHGLFVARSHTGGSTLDSLIVSADAGGAPFVKLYNDTSDIGTAGDHLLANSFVVHTPYSFEGLHYRAKGFWMVESRFWR